jgi:hypothetical protein
MVFILSNGWQAYDPYTARQDQFIHNGSEWVFDPTVMFTMGSSDYMTIVNYVKNNISSDYIDSYGTAEFYSGASAYYGNFDIRSGNWEDSVFGTWEEAIAFTIGEGLLPAKFPDAVTQVSGIDVFYIVTFDTYSGVDGRYSIKFQVTKAGPNPEFTLVDGPTAL